MNVCIWTLRCIKLGSTSIQLTSGKKTKKLTYVFAYMIIASLFISRQVKCTSHDMGKDIWSYIS